MKNKWKSYEYCQDYAFISKNDRKNLAGSLIEVIKEVYKKLFRSVYEVLKKCIRSYSDVYMKFLRSV